MSPGSLYFDAKRLQTALTQLHERAQRNNYTEERLRREQARCVVQALMIKRTWYGPAVCEDCSYFHGQGGINCAPHPSGPPATHCPDWQGSLLQQEENYVYESSRGWTRQRYEPGAGWQILEEHLAPHLVSAGLDIAKFYVMNPTDS